MTRLSPSVFVSVARWRDLSDSQLAQMQCVGARGMAEFGYTQSDDGADSGPDGGDGGQSDEDLDENCDEKSKTFTPQGECPVHDIVLTVAQEGTGSGAVSLMLEMSGVFQMTGEFENCNR
eukprot:1176423-Prorocentrum_minimum.AAC.1